MEKRMRLVPPRAADSRYVYLPFDVPTGTVAVTIELAYDRAGGANAIDLGLFDARFSGSPLDQRGFRGWSGGRRKRVTIAQDRATPSCLPGPIQAGTWRVILGLYRIALEGVEVTLRFTTEQKTSVSAATAPIAVARSDDATVTLLAPRSASSPTNGASAMPAARAPQRASLPPSRGKSSGWFRGDLHLHTVHSDGDWAIEELVTRAQSTGLDFIAITDHNTLTSSPRRAAGGFSEVIRACARFIGRCSAQPYQL
ncbi:PHP domain-containing protein [Pyrinomonas sp.]|uniref:PHP domain-containing protein n=1 Tax=Pyrinomonas sp. TaxID=2080306 RepID=UPI00331FDBF6